MNIEELFSNGIVTPNPNYNARSAKKGEPKYIQDTNPEHYETAAHDAVWQSLPDSYVIDDVKNLDSYLKYGVTPTPFDSLEDLDRKRGENQSAWAQAGNALMQTLVSEIGLGIPKAMADIFEFNRAFYTGDLFKKDYDFSNPVSETLEKWQDTIKDEFAIYQKDPNATMLDGAMGDFGWWMSNVPSVASSLTLMVPGAVGAKAIQIGGKLLKSAATAARIAKAVRNSEKLYKGVQAVKPVFTAGTKANAVASTIYYAGVSRIGENVQEASQLHKEMREQAKEMFNDENFDKQKFIDDNTVNGQFKYDFALKEGSAPLIEQIDEQGNKTYNRKRTPDEYDWDKIADGIAYQSAKTNFIANSTNFIFDAIQVYYLKNFLKGFRTKASTIELDKYLKQQGNSWRRTAQDIANDTKKSKFLDNITTYGKGFGRTFAGEWTEGIEEGINYISQEYGMHTGKVLLGDAKDDFRISSYLTDGKLWDSAFWGVLGGIAFQGIGSGLGRAYNKLMKHELESEDKRRKDNVDDSLASMSNMIKDFNRIENGYDIYNLKPDGKRKKLDGASDDEIYEKFEEDGVHTVDELKEQAKTRLANDVIAKMAFNSAQVGNSELLVDLLRNPNVLKQLKDAGIIQDDDDDNFIRKATDVIESVNKKMDNAITAVHSHNVPPEYAMIIASNLVRSQIDTETFEQRIANANDAISRFMSVPENKDLIEPGTLDRLKHQITADYITAEIRNLKEELDKLDKAPKTISNELRKKELQEQINHCVEVIDGLDDSTRWNSWNLINRYNVRSISSTEDADKWLEDYLRKDLLTEYSEKTLSTEEGKADYEDNVNKAKAKVINRGFGASVIEVEKESPVLASLIRKLGATSASKVLIENKGKLTKENIENALKSIEYTFSEARVKTRKAAFDILDKLADKYDADEILNYVNNINNSNSTYKINGITKDEQEALDDAIRMLDLTAKDDGTFDAIKQRLFSKKLEKELKSKEVEEDEQEAEKGSEENEKVEETEESNSSSTGGQESTTKEPSVVTPTYTQVENAVDEPEIVETKDDDSTPLTENVVTEQSEVETPPAPIETPAPSGSFNAVCEEVLHENAVTTAADMELARSAYMVILHAKVMAFLKKNYGSFEKFAEYMTHGKQYFETHKPDLPIGNRVDESMNSSLEELIIESNDKSFEKKVISFVQKYAKDSKSVITYTVNGKTKYAVKLQALIRYATERSNRILAEEVYNELAKFLIDHNKKKDRTIILIDDEQSLFSDEYFENTKRSNEEIYKDLTKPIDKKAHAETDYILKNLKGEERKKYVDAYNTLKAGEELEYKPVAINGAIEYVAIYKNGVHIASIPVPKIDENGYFTKTNDCWLYKVKIDNGRASSPFGDWLKEHLVNQEFIAMLYEATVSNNYDAVKNYLKKNKGEQFIAIDDYSRLVNHLIKLLAYNEADMSSEAIKLSIDDWINKLASTYSTVFTLTKGNAKIVVEDLPKGKTNITQPGEQDVPSKSMTKDVRKKSKIAISDSDSKPIISGNKDEYKGTFSGVKNPGQPFVCIPVGNDYSFVHVDYIDVDEVKHKEGNEIIQALKNKLIYTIRDFYNASPEDSDAKFDELCEIWAELFPVSYNKVKTPSIFGAASKPHNKSRKIGAKVFKNDRGAAFVSITFGNKSFNIYKNNGKGNKANTFGVKDIDENGNSRSGYYRGYDTDAKTADIGSITVLVNDIFSNLSIRFDNTFVKMDSAGGSFGTKLDKNGKYSEDSIFYWDNGELTVNIKYGDKTFKKTYKEGFSQFVLDNDFCKCHTKVVNGSNFDIKRLSEPTSENGKQSLSTEIKIGFRVIDRPPVEEHKRVIPQRKNSAQNFHKIVNKIDKNRSKTERLLEVLIGKDKLNLIKGLPILSNNVIFVDEELTDSNGKIVEAQTNADGTIVLGKTFEQMFVNNPQRAARILIHENIHGVLKVAEERKKLDNIKGIFEEFKESLNNDEYIKQFVELLNNKIDEQNKLNGENKQHYTEEQIKSWLNSLLHTYSDENKVLEEFLVESLTNKNLVDYLNIAKAKQEDAAHDDNLSIWQKILKFIGDVFGFDITPGSLREKEFYALSDLFTPKVEEKKEEIKKPITTSRNDIDDLGFDDEDLYSSLGELDDATARRIAEIENEMEAIKQDALLRGTFMKAPNGKESNLNERQWLQVRTKEFKDWFGDWENDPENASKIVDENGEPLVVWHNTYARFNTFEFTNEAMIHFGTRQAAENRGGDNNRPFFLNIKDLHEYPDGMWYGMKILDDMYREGLVTREQINEIRIKADKARFADYLENRGAEAAVYAEEIQNIFGTKESGIIYINEVEDKGSYSYGILNPNQAKSATDNIGTFSKEDDDTMNSAIGEIDSEITRYDSLANSLDDFINSKRAVENVDSFLGQFNGSQQAEIRRLLDAGLLKISC